MDGIIGYVRNPAIIRGCINIGNVSAIGVSGLLGGVIGDTNITTIEDNYFYRKTTNVPSVGVGSGPNTGITEILTSTNAKKQSTYIGWDFTNIWKIDEGSSIPYLRELPKPSGVTF